MIHGSPLILESQVMVTRHEKQCWHGFLHSCECWFLLVQLGPSTVMLLRIEVNVASFTVYQRGRK